MDNTTLLLVYGNHNIYFRTLYQPVGISIKKHLFNIPIRNIVRFFQVLGTILNLFQNVVFRYKLQMFIFIFKILKMRNEKFKLK